MSSSGNNNKANEPLNSLYTKTGQDQRAYGLSPKRLLRIADLSRAVLRGEAGRGQLIGGPLRSASGLKGRIIERVWGEGVSRTESVIVDLDAGALGKGSLPNKSAQSTAKLFAGEQADAGHIVANNWGGSGRLKSGNTYPANIHLNRGQIKQFEQQIAGLVKAGNKVRVHVKLLYGDNPLRPDFVSYRVWSNGRITGSPRVYNNNP